MSRRKPTKTVEELIDYIATGHPKDVFYSDVSRYVKSAGYSTDVFLTVCKALRERGIWVHS